MLSKIEENKIISSPIEDTLSKKEKEILQLLSQGLANKEIAENLYVTEKLSF